MRDWLVVVCIAVFLSAAEPLLGDLGILAAQSAEPFCEDLSECDGAWPAGSAFSCTDGRCRCHPDATFDSTNGCVCHAEFQRVGRECRPVLGGSCIVSSNCSTTENAVCTNKVCTCNADTVRVDGFCKEAPTTVGGGCEVEQQCTLKLGSEAECNGYQCSCKQGAVAATLTAGQRCLKKMALGRSCEASVQCQHNNNSLCKDQICSCSPSFVDWDNKECLPVVWTYGMACKAGVQCTPEFGQFANCRNDVCVCEEDYYFSGERCLRKNGLGAKCGGTDQGCWLEGDGDTQRVTCQQEVCRCSPNSVESADKRQCVPSGVQAVVASLSIVLVALVMGAAGVCTYST